jgi:hypothetical protein
MTQIVRELSQPVSNQKADVVGTGSPDLEGYGKGESETACLGARES